MHGHAPLVEPEEDGLRLHALDPETHEMWQPVDRIAEDRQPLDRLGPLTQQPLGEGLGRRGLG